MTFWYLFSGVGDRFDDRSSKRVPKLQKLECHVFILQINHDIKG